MQTLELNKITPTAPFGNGLDDTYLFVNAHPDDTEVFMSAAVDQSVQAGTTVVSLVATNGEQSTKGNAEFVNSGGRIGESRFAHAILGVPSEHQFYPGLPDGQLHKPHNRALLGQKLLEVSLAHTVTDIITPGDEGVDGHSDHQHVHYEAVRTAARLARLGRFINVWALDRTGGDQHVFVDPAAKACAVAAHTSQFSGADRADLLAYADLLTDRESYRRIAIPIHGLQIAA